MTSSIDRSQQSFWGIFGVPLLLAMLSAVGLVSALVGDGVWDGISWLTLAMPVVIPMYFVACGPGWRKAAKPSSS